MNTLALIIASFFIYSSDGTNSVGSLRCSLPNELNNKSMVERIEAGWFEYVSTAPVAHSNEIVICTGFVRNGYEFTGVYEVMEIHIEELQYSVQSIIRELKEAGNLEAVRKIVNKATNGYDIFGLNYISENDSNFTAMIHAIVVNGIMTQAELDEMLPKCIWSAE